MIDTGIDTDIWYRYIDIDIEMVFVYERVRNIRGNWPKNVLCNLCNGYVDIYITFYRFLLCLKCFLIWIFWIVARIISGIKRCVSPQCFIEISKGKSLFEGFPLSLKLRFIYLNYILDPKHLYHLSASSPNLPLPSLTSCFKVLLKCRVWTGQWLPELKYSS